MIHTSECVSLGHPDKVADGIVSYILDRYIERDKKVRFGLECQIKDNFVTLGGEITTSAKISNKMIKKWVREAIVEIGYTEGYARRWGKKNCIDPNGLDIEIHISRQSPDIAQGVDAEGWGDQGIFWGMATTDASSEYMPKDMWIARYICSTLYDIAKADYKANLGLDIKTQVSMVDDCVKEVIVAIPIKGSDKAKSSTLSNIIGLVSAIAMNHSASQRTPNVIVNGTGSYVRHSSQGDCGTTGRKLAVDFYGGNCRIGGGCPWGKDATKADVSLNAYARHIAIAEAKKAKQTVYCAISCCIGRKEIEITLFDEHMHQIRNWSEKHKASMIIRALKTDSPTNFYRCQCGFASFVK